VQTPQSISFAGYSGKYRQFAIIILFWKFVCFNAKSYYIALNLKFKNESYKVDDVTHSLD
jgi:hypothetical protein